MWIFSRDESKSALRQSHSQLESLVLERTGELQTLTQRLLRVQDEERRRVARDLHDSTGQTLTALKISIALLQRKLGDDEDTRSELYVIEQLADQALQEIRTTSYLLHPPLLDEAGFASAAQWYVEGYGKRSKINVRMDFGSELERMPEAIEIALFRVLQESLTNVHRHSGSSEVDVTFRREARAAILEVRDYGCGLPKDLLNRAGVVRGSGVGLTGMRERINELKGEVEIEEARPGTRVRATVPLVPRLYPLALDSCIAAARPSLSEGASQASPSQAS